MSPHFVYPHLLPGQRPSCPQDVLRGAAEEVLAALKNDKLKDPERQAEVRCSSVCVCLWHWDLIWA